MLRAELCVVTCFDGGDYWNSRTAEASEHIIYLPQNICKLELRYSKRERENGNG